MKGPYERLKYDFRRVWECPACRHRERTGGDTTTLFCACQAAKPAGQQVAMKLVDEGGRRVWGSPVRRKSSFPPGPQ